MPVHGKLVTYQCHLLIAFANNLEPDQAQQNIGPDLDGIPERIVRKR